MNHSFSDYDLWKLDSGYGDPPEEPTHRSDCECDPCCDANSLAEARRIGYTGPMIKFSKADIFTHGRDCPKAEHDGTGYLHDRHYDTPYDVDGVTYCGRCHGFMGRSRDSQG